MLTEARLIPHGVYQRIVNLHAHFSFLLLQMLCFYACFKGRLHGLTNAIVRGLASVNAHASVPLLCKQQMLKIPQFHSGSGM